MCECPRPRPRRARSGFRQQFKIVTVLLWLGLPAFAGSGPLGFGQSTTGGGRTPTLCHVRILTIDAVQRCVSTDAPVQVVFDVAGTLRMGDRRLGVGSNKTIDGMGRIAVVGDRRLFDIVGENIIIRGLRFASTLVSWRPGQNCAAPARPLDVLGCGVAIDIHGSARNVWVDHNEFSHCGDKCIVVWAYAAIPGPDGHVPAPDLISISGNYIHDSYYGILAGVATQVAASEMPPHERVTIYDNYFRNILRRSPRAASGAWIHAFNNVVEDFGGAGSCRGGNYGFASSAVGAAQLFLENNVYIAWPNGCKAAIEVSDHGSESGPRGPGRVKEIGNLALNGALLLENEPALVFDPHAAYSYRVLPAQQVTGAIIHSAGPLAAGPLAKAQ